MGVQTLRILVDQREKKPLPFPAYLPVLRQDRTRPLGPTLETIQISVERRTIPTADYLLGPEPGCVYAPHFIGGAGIVERKASLDELDDNLFNPVRRPAFEALLTRMRATFAHPLLLLDGGFRATARTSSTLAPRAAILDALQRLLLNHNISHCIWSGQSDEDRRQCADWCARWLHNASTLNAWQTNGSSSAAGPPSSPSLPFPAP